MVEIGPETVAIEIGMKNKILTVDQQFEILEQRLADSEFTLSRRDRDIYITGDAADSMALKEWLHRYFEKEHKDIYVLIQADM